MQVRHDNFGNLIGRKEGRIPGLPVVMMGSHIDTVPNGGRFDGTIGVISAIEVVHAITENKLKHNHPIEVVAFCDEEGSRFSDGLFGSRGMVGLVNSKALELKDESGISRYNALESFGYGINPAEVEKSVRTKDSIKLYLEMHIEQGPLLEEWDVPVGIVKGIAGPAWLSFLIEGEAGHAGTVPMGCRKDPMIGAAEIIKEIETICKSDSTETMVATIGKIQANPGGRNVVPESVEFTLDIRDVDLARRQTAILLIEEKTKEICEKRGLNFHIEKVLEIDPVTCSPEVVEAQKIARDELKLDAPLIVSGAGHDAMFLARIAPMGMIFVRCRKGISHNPAEWASKEDIETGTELLLNTVIKFI